MNPAKRPTARGGTLRRLVLPLALAFLLVIACGGQNADAPSATSTSNSATTAATKSTTSSPKPTTSKVAPTTTAAPIPVTFSIECYTSGTYATYQEAWKYQLTGNSCFGAKKSGTEYTPQQLQAYATGFDPVQGIGMDFRLGELYEKCATMGDVIAGNYFFVKPEEARAAAGQLILCPDHPNAVAIQAAIDKFNSLQVTMSSNLAEATVRSQAVADGIYAESGKHLVGTEIEPGTWQTVKDKVEDCYWELSDASGNIIDNNFISVAPQFTLVIPADAAGFTNTGCAFRRIGD